MGDDEISNAGLRIEMVVKHDAGRGMVANDITQRPHPLELTVVAHDDKVSSLHNGTHLVLVPFIDENILSSRNPFEEVRENVWRYDADIGIRQTATEPGGQCCSGTYGIAIGAAVTGDEDMARTPTPKGEEFLKEGALFGGEKWSQG